MKIQTRKKFIFARNNTTLCVWLFALLFPLANSRADVLASWNFSTLTAGTFPPSVVAASLTVSAMNTNSPATGFTAWEQYSTSYANPPVLRVVPPSATAASATSSNAFFSWTMMPGPGFLVTLTYLTLPTARGGASTPRGLVVRSSVDNYAADLFATEVPTARPILTTNQIPLGSEFQNLSGVTFRIYPYAPSGASVEFDDVVVEGTVVSAGPVHYQTRVETAADGNGVVVPTQSLGNNSLTLYAIARDSSAGFVTNTAATWSLTNITGNILASDLVVGAGGTSATFTGHGAGSAQIVALGNATNGYVPSGILTVTNVVAAPPSHPFIIVQTNDYSALQALSVGGSSKQPFIRMRTDAISISGFTTYNESAAIGSRAGSIIKIMDSSALGYIVDPANRNTYRDRIYNYMKYWDLAQSGNMTKDLFINSWDAAVETAAAFFATIVALDIIYNDPGTTPVQLAQRDGFNAMMEVAGVAGTGAGDGTMGPATFFTTQYEPYHLESLMSARATWAMWRDGLNNNSNLDEAVATYKQDWLDHMTADGHYREFSGYALARSGDPSRYNKGVFHDVIVYAGIDTNWYANPVMAKFYEWLGGYAFAPNRFGWPIGDSSYGPIASTYASYYDRAGKFSPLAANYGDWQMNGAIPAAKLFSYLVRARSTNTVTAQEPGSRIFADGAAYLRQKNGGVNALAAVLTNLKFMSVPNIGHMHKSMNSLSIAAFGEIMLRGPGYNGFGAAATDANNFGFDFSYVNNHAISENIALFNYSIGDYQNPSFTSDHRAKFGGYGVSGLLSDGLDYATGDSGLLTDVNRAINNGHQIRHVVTIYPQNGANGYVYAMDELEGNSSATIGQLAWHPYSSNIVFNADNSSNDRYEWQIKKRAQSADLYLSIYMPTAPDTKQQYDGLFADDIAGGFNSFVGRYIFNGYNLNASTKKRNVLTLFYPRRVNEAVPAMERMTATGTGGVTNQAAAFAVTNGITDFAFESDGTSERTVVSATYDPVGTVARGKVVVYRKFNGGGGTNVAFYFVGKGRSFKNVPVNFTSGFVSDADIDLHMKGGTGALAAATSANVTFYAPGNPLVWLDGKLLAALSSGTNFMQVAVPSGTHTVELSAATPFDAWRVTNFTTAQLSDPAQSGPDADLDGDGMKNFVEYALGTNPTVFSTTGQPVGGFDVNGQFAISFFRAASDVTYIVEASGDLSSWDVIATNPGAVGQTVSVPDNAPPNTSPRFLRVKFFR